MTAWAWLTTLLWTVGFVVAALPLGSVALWAAERVYERAGGIGESDVAPRPGARYAIAFLVGFGVEGVIGMLLGLAQAFYKWTLIAVWIVIVVSGHRSIRRYSAWAWSRRAAVAAYLTSPLRLLGVFVAGSLALSTYVAAVTPPTYPDELAYHIPEAQILANMHHLPLNLGGHFFYGNIPKLGETLYGEAISLSGDLSLPRVLQTTILMAFLIYAASALRTLVGAGVGLLAGCFLLYLDDLTQYAPSAYVDTMSACYEVAALLSAAVWIERRRASDAVTTALVLGIALSVKYSALPAAAFLAVIFALLLLRVSAPLRVRLASAASLAAIPIVVAGFWYAKNAARYGNPFYPLYLGHTGVSQAEYQSLLDAIQQFGPRTLHAFVRIPLRFGVLGGLPLFLGWYMFPFVALVGRARRGLLLLAAFVPLYTTYWFFLGTHQTRFLANAEAVVVILFAVVLLRLDSFPLRVAIAAIAVTAIQLGSPHMLDGSHGWHATIGQKVWSPDWDYAFGRQSRTAYLESSFGCEYGAVSYAQTHLNGVVMDNWTQWHDSILSIYTSRVPFVTLSPEPDIPARTQLRRADMHYAYVREGTKQRFGEETKAQPGTIEAAYYRARYPVEQRALRDATVIWHEGDCRIYRLNGV